MLKTLCLSFSLKNTYRVNGILYAIKQLPLLKKLLPDALYGVHGLKLLANILSCIWEIITVFAGKLLYLASMVAGAGLLYRALPKQQVFLHILLFLSILGALVNTYLFNPSKDKYYALVSMRMDAKSYTLVNYGYAIVKVIVGFLPFTILFGNLYGLPIWICLLIPFSIAGLKLTAAALSLREYEQHHTVKNENNLDKLVWLAIALLLALSYGLPAAGFVFPIPVYIAVLVLAVVCGTLSVRKICTFASYREMCQQILADSIQQKNTAQQKTANASRKLISADTRISSQKKGFEYLNDLFIKRHKTLLWKASQIIALVCAGIFAVILIAFPFFPSFRQKTNELLMVFLPWFVFVLYAINRGTGFTQALFMNCDHSLLTYPFYKQPAMILKLFTIRLREIIKINLLPAAVIGAGLMLLLWASGGTANPIHYAVLLVSIICMSIFFSVHYLVIYYLIQPYNAATEMKSAAYPLVQTATYLVSFYIMKLRMDTLVFGLLTILFCILYCGIACMLVYRLAPKTFRLRN